MPRDREASGDLRWPGHQSVQGPGGRGPRWPGAEVAEGDPGGGGRDAAVGQVGQGMFQARVRPARVGPSGFLHPGRAAPPLPGSGRLFPRLKRMPPLQRSNAFPSRKLTASFPPELFSRAAQYLIICWVKSFTYVARLVCPSHWPTYKQVHTPLLNAGA